MLKRFMQKLFQFEVLDDADAVFQAVAFTIGAATAWYLLTWIFGNG